MKIRDISREEYDKAWEEWCNLCRYERCSENNQCLLRNNLYNTCRELMQAVEECNRYRFNLFVNDSSGEIDRKGLFLLMEGYLLKVGTNLRPFKVKQLRIANNYIKKHKKELVLPYVLMGQIIIDYFAVEHTSTENTHTHINRKRGIHIEFRPNNPDKVNHKNTSVEIKTLDNPDELDAPCEQTPQRVLEKKEIELLAKKFWNRFSEQEHAALYAKLNGYMMSDKNLLALLKIPRSSLLELVDRILETNFKSYLKDELRIESVGQYWLSIRCQLIVLSNEWAEESKLGKSILSTPIKRIPKVRNIGLTYTSFYNSHVRKG